MRPIEPVVLDDYHEVLALHRMLMHAKFESGIDDVYVGSPYIAAVQRRFADALQAATPGSGWDRWRDAREHAHRLPKIRTYLMRALPSIAADKRRQFVLDVFAPLLPSADLVDELLAEAAE